MAAMKALRLDKIAQLGSHPVGFANHHLIAQRPLANGDLLPTPVAGRETPCGRIELPSIPK